MNINGLLRLLMILLAAMFILSACGSREEGDVIPKGQVSENVKAQMECWQGPIFEQIYDVMGSTVMKMYSTVTQGAMNVMMIGFAIWLAIRLLKFVSSVTEQNAAEVWNEVLRKAFLCVFCGILASTPEMSLYVLNTLVFPLYHAFLELGSNILGASSQAMSNGADTMTVMGDEIKFGEYSLTCTSSASFSATMDAFPAGPQQMMECMICAVASRLKLGLTIALTVMTDTSGNLTPFIVGFIMWGTFFVVYIGFVFYLVDTMFRFAMMVLLLPIFTMAYAFGPTRKWTSVGLTNILNSAAFMMAFSIIIAMAMTSIVSLITGRQEIFNPENPQMHFQDMSIVMMCLLLISFLILGSLKIAQQLSSAIIGGNPDAKFQQHLKAVGQMVLGWVTGGASWALNKAGFYEKTWMGRQIKKGNAARHRLNQLAGREKKPNVDVRSIPGK